MLCAAGCGGKTLADVAADTGGSQAGGALPTGEATVAGSRGKAGTGVTPDTGNTPIGGALPTSGPATGGGIMAGGGRKAGTDVTSGTGNTPIGGAPPTWGPAADGGLIGAGCTGSFERIQKVNGQDLCVAKQVWISGPSGSSDYQIDATEVTRGQYESWVATDPALPRSSDAACGWKATGGDADASTDGDADASTGGDADASTGDDADASTDGYDEASSCMTASAVCQGSGCDHHPVVCVDWCDAYYYCVAVGKRLCGKIGGGSLAFSSDSYMDPSESQWYRVCSSGGATTYPYGNTFQADYCNGYEYWKEDSKKWKTMPVATFGWCQSSTTGYTGAYDLSGSVWEWEDSCHKAYNGRPACLMRGGAFDSFGSSGYIGGFPEGMDCDFSSNFHTYASKDLGFRCCSL